MENEYWKKVPSRWWDKKSTEYVGQLNVPDPENPMSVIATADLAGIPKTHWHLIEKEEDTSDCYYESDKPETVWRSPLSVFDT